MRDLPPVWEPEPPAAPPPAPALEVIDGGLLTTVQDLGRFGHRRQGVPWAGAMDAPHDGCEDCVAEETMDVNCLSACAAAVLGLPEPATLPARAAPSLPCPCEIEPLRSTGPAPDPNAQRRGNQNFRRR